MSSQVLRSHKVTSKATISSHVLPKAWPQGVTYLTSPEYSRNIDHQLLRLDKDLGKPSAIPFIALKAQGLSPLVRIKPISNPSHPANGQHGLFATQNLLPGTFILPYLGFVHGSVDADLRSDYDLGLDAELGIAVDASSMGNETRFINDYRGVSATGPNAEFRDVVVDFGNGVPQKWIGVFVLSAGKVKSGKRAKGIAKSEEILVSYGKGFWNGRRGEEQLEISGDVK
jgi:hypothetical protein